MARGKADFPQFPGAAAEIPLSDRLRERGVGLRPALPRDIAFLAGLYASFRAMEMASVGWPAKQKRAFLDDQFGLQHQHFTAFFPQADFWIVTRAQPAQRIAPIGRLYLDRSAPMWHVVDIGFTAAERGKGLGEALIAWIQQSAGASGAGGVALQVALNNPRARAFYLRAGFLPSGKFEGHHEQLDWRVS